MCEQPAKSGEKSETSLDNLEPPPTAAEYLVSPKDVLEITIVGEKDLPVNFEVSDKDGAINYPFIGYVEVIGKTVKQVEQLLTERLKDGWFVSPQVNVRVAMYSQKLVYVHGKVNRPGQHPFSGRNRMTVYRAIIMAGGFAPNASEKKVKLTTTDGKGKQVVQTIDVSDIMRRNPELDPPIKADDIIEVPETFF